MPKKINKIIALLIITYIFVIIVLRAFVMGITYDEAFTFLAYSKPLADDTSMWTLKNIWYTCVANNHWMYTIMESILLKTTGIMYNEFIIRLPAVIFGLVYLCISYIEYIKERISGFTFLLLVFNYYVGEFFSLGRGYGVSAALVLAGLVLYERWKNSEYNKNIYLMLSIGALLLSSYANSVSLVPCFCVGAIALFKIIQNHTLGQLFKYIPLYPFAVLYALMGVIILKYHFNVTKEGMGAYVAEDVSLWGLIKEYIGMLPTNDTVVIIVSVLAVSLTAAAILYLLIKKQFLECDYMLAMLLYFLCLILMIGVFARGGMTGRTLIPAFPLIAYGFGQMISKTATGLIKNKRILIVIFSAIALIFTVFYVSRTDIYHVDDWYDDCEVKVRRTSADYVFNGNNASDVFYFEADNALNSLQ